MNISQLDEHFEVQQYEPNKAGYAVLYLEGGTVAVRIPYNFYVADGSVKKLKVDGVATAQQLTDLYTALAAVLQATNAGIEAEHGWTRYVEPE
jgi:hypothetical protein